MKKTISVIIAICMLLSVLCSCSSHSEQSARIVITKDYTSIGMLKLLEDESNGQTEGLCSFNKVDTPELLYDYICKGEFDFACVSAATASRLCKQCPDTVMIAGVTGLNCFYLLENGSEINSVYDLDNTTVIIGKEGSDEDIIFRSIINKAGVNCDIEYKDSQNDLSDACVSGDVSLALLPVPFSSDVLDRNLDFRIALDLYDVWNELFVEEEKFAEIFSSCLIVRRGYVENNPENTEEIIGKYSESISYGLLNPDEAEKLTIAHEFVQNDNIARKYVLSSGSVLIRTDSVFGALKYFLGLIADFDDTLYIPEDDQFYHQPVEEAESNSEGLTDTANTVKSESSENTESSAEESE